MFGCVVCTGVVFVFGVSCVHDKALVDVEFHQPVGLPSPKCVKILL